MAGIDPGGKTGVVVLELPIQSRDLASAAWVGSFSISGLGETKTRSKAEGVAQLYARVRDCLARHEVRELAIECPVDALPTWGGRKNNPSTLFSLGANYGLCLAAAHAAGVQRIRSYRVSTTKKHAGWMPMVREPSRKNPNRMVTHVQRRDVTLQQLRAKVAPMRERAAAPAFGVRRRSAIAPMTEDELMAFGVLEYHLRRSPLPPTS